MSESSLKRSAASGIRWLLLKSIIGECTTVASTVVLARLVSPAEFGHAAVALLFVLLAVIVTFEGFASALVQRAEVEERHREVAVLMNLIGGAVLAGAVLGSALLIWPSVFGEETAALIAFTAPAFVIASLGAVSRAALWRQLAFRRITQIDLAAGFLGTVSTVAMAALGMGAHALVFGALIGIAVGSALLLVAAPEPLPRWHRSSAREIMRFGLPAASAGIVTQLFGNIDYWIVAARLSAFQTGIYYRAFNVGVVYQSKISNVMMQLAFPVYSRMKDRAMMRALHDRAARVHATVIFPFLAMLIAVAPLAIPFVFGSAWRAAVAPAQILAVAGMASAVLTGYPQIIQAAGRPHTLLAFNLAALATYGAAIALSVSYGLSAVAIAATAVHVAVLAAAYKFLLGPYIGLTVRALIPQLGPPLAGSLVLIAACVPLRIALATRLPVPVTLAVVGVVGLALYVALIRVAFYSTWQDLATLLRRTLPTGRRLKDVVPSAASSLPLVEPALSGGDGRSR